MPDKADNIRFLFERARRLRELAELYRTEATDQLLEIARDLEAWATELENRT